MRGVKALRQTSSTPSDKERIVERCVCVFVQSWSQSRRLLQPAKACETKSCRVDSKVQRVIFTIFLLRGSSERKLTALYLSSHFRQHSPAPTDTHFWSLSLFAASVRPAAVAPSWASLTRHQPPQKKRHALWLVTAVSRALKGSGDRDSERRRGPPEEVEVQVRPYPGFSAKLMTDEGKRDTCTGVDMPRSLDAGF